MSDNIDTESSASPINYLKIFFRRKELIIIPAFLGLVIGLASGLLIPKQYKASTILLVEEGKTDNPLFDQLAVSTTVSQRMSSIRESMLGWYSMVTLAERLGLTKNIKNQHEFEQLLLGIRSDIDIKLRAANIIDLSYVGKDPIETRDVVKTISEIFIERNIETQNQETTDAITFIEEQLKLYRSKIKSTEIALLKDNLRSLLIDATEFHPFIKQLKEQIAAKEAELKAENLEYIEDANLDAQTVSPIINQIRSALDNIDGSRAIKVTGENPENDYYKLLIAEKLDDVMARDANVNNSIYATLLSRLETAKITQRLQSSKEGTKYVVLDPPRVPLKPFWPNKILIAFVGLISGIVLGVGLVFGLEFLDQSFLDVEEANRFFREPLLGAISKIQTELGIKQERDRAAWMYCATFIGGLTVLVLTLLVKNYLIS